MATSDQSGGLNRSLPVLSSEAATNGNLSDSSGSGRVHTSSSVPRTKFTAHTPAAEREGIQQLKTKMTFSDHSADSSGRSTPKQSNLLVSKAADRPSSKAADRPSIQPVPAPSYVLDSGHDEAVSEGELPGAVTVAGILTKLDSVKTYLKEAEGLHKQLKEKATEPEVSDQIDKLERLISDLRQQESSYLAILLKIMDHADLNTTQEDSDSEYSEDSSSEEEVTPGEDGLSLRAQLDQSGALTAEQEEELRVLKQQQQMLRDLIEQQEKIKELEKKQAELLRRRSHAQRQLELAEARSQEYHRRTEEAAATQGDADLTQGTEDDGRAALLKRIAALKERKDKLEDLMDSFAQVQLKDGSEEGAESGQSQDEEEADELVAATDDPRMTELEVKLRRAAEAKRKLHELRHMIDDLKEATADDDQLQWRLALTKADQDPADTTLDEQGDLDASLVADYQQRLTQKRQEVEDLQRQKAQLLVMQENLLAMQEKYMTDPDEAPDETTPVPTTTADDDEEGGLPEHLAQELHKQQQLYQEIMTKTQKLKDLRTQYQDELAKTSEHDTYSLTSSTRLLTDADLTAATWGGSTVQTDEDSETGCSDTSLPPASEQELGQTLGGSASVQHPSGPHERVAFSVTRHTPRRHGARRTLSDSGEAPDDKRRKLDPTIQHSKSTGARMTSGPSAARSGGISHQQRPSTVTRDSCTQTPSHAPHASPNVTLTPSAEDTSQLNFMNRMCAELLRGQNSMIAAVCQRMMVDADMNRLFAYHRELEAYYHTLCEKLQQSEQQSDGEQPQPTQTATSDNSPRPQGPEVNANRGSSHSMRPPPCPPSYTAGPCFPWSSNPHTVFPSPSSFNFNPTPRAMSPAGGTLFNLSPNVSSSWTPQFPGNVSRVHFAEQQQEMTPPGFVFGAQPQGTAQPGFSFGAHPQGSFSFGGQPQGTAQPVPTSSVSNSTPGITSASAQVQAPTAPLSSAPSVSTAASLNNNNNNTGLNVQQGDGRPRKPPVGASRPTVSEQQETAGASEQESVSSVPLSVPGDSQRHSSALLSGQATGAAGFSVFDALRDTIYSEVATLIANNEARPHFLVELFRELQLLNSDYLRQRALYNIQDLVTRFLTGEQSNAAEPGDWTDSVSETTEERAPLSNTTSQAYDYVEQVQSASSLSTPPDPPFASEGLGDTVKRLDKALAQVKIEAQGGSPGLQPPVVSPGGLDEEQESTEPEQEAVGGPELDTQLLDEQIKDIMTEVIPVLKANMASQCSAQLLDQIKNIVINHVLKQEQNRSPDFLEMLTKQLDSTIGDALQKYSSKQFKDCGEDMLVDLSEVLFNELSFFSLMRDLRDHPQLSSDFRSVTSSQTTTESEGEGDKPMDPLLLQVLTLQASRALVDEDESLGKVRDDELAKSWDNTVQSDGEKSAGSKDTPMASPRSVNQDPPSQNATPVPSIEDNTGTNTEGKDGVAHETNGVKDGLSGGPASGNIDSAGAIGVEESGQHNPASPAGHSLEATAQPVSLDVQMKTEQESIEGIPAILATIEEQGQELAGNTDEVPSAADLSEP